jgi:uncharacterized membrane protein YphA (DoxX/SURF4 family)
MFTGSRRIFPWLLRILAALIMLQSLFFKFSAAPESVYIFTTLHMEPWGRIGTGVMELIASVLILLPATTVLGALLAMGIMAGAILSHILFLGITVQGDGGQLFLYALLVFLCSAALLWIFRRQLTRFIPGRFLTSRIHTPKTDA